MRESVHVHALVLRGGWTRAGEWVTIAFPDRQDLEVSRTGCLAPTLFAANKVACLASPSCGSGMKVIAFISEHDVIDSILRHLERRETEEAETRAPPN